MLFSVFNCHLVTSCVQGDKLLTKRKLNYVANSVLNLKQVAYELNITYKYVLYVLVQCKWSRYANSSSCYMYFDYPSI